MIDVVAVLFLMLLLVRGWIRGFVREAMDLVGLVLGTVMAFRFGPVLASLIDSAFDVSTGAARLIGGLTVLFAVSLGAAFATRALERRFRMPGLNMVNRAGGAGLAAAWGVFLATLVLTLGVVLPMPAAVADQLESSAVTRTLTDPDGLPQEVFTGLAGDRIIQALLNLRELVGARKVVIEPGERIEIPPADFDELKPDQAAADEIFTLVNVARIEAGLPHLEWSDDLTAVGIGHAVEMYVNGYFSHTSPTTGDVGDRLRAAGVGFSIAGENLALAVTATDVHNGLMASPGHRANILGADYRRVGIAVISGPLGLMTVQVFTG
jgi:uncharacterized protein YkwD